jgi:hypothetical protein
MKVWEEERKSRERPIVWTPAEQKLSNKRCKQHIPTEEAPAVTSVITHSQHQHLSANSSIQHCACDPEIPHYISVRVASNLIFAGL